MSSEWASASFADLMDRGALEIGDGYRAKNDELGGEGLIFLRAGHVKDTHIDFGGVDRFLTTNDSRFGPKIARAGDVVITTKGNSTGRVAYVTAAMPRFVYSPHLSYWRSTGAGVVEQGFLRAWSQSTEFLEQLAALSRSTDMAPYLSLSDQRRLRIALPPRAVQKLVAMVNDALHDRIALLRETNATLEAIAQALFKSWFVDFDPVRAKSQGLAPAGMDDATATLFPDGFDEARRGPVPRGWTEASIYEVAQVVYGAPFASSRFNTDGIGRPLVRIRDLRDEAPGVHTDEVHPKGYLLTPGDIVVGMDGEFRAYLWGGERAWLNQRVCVFRPKAGVPAAFVRATIEPQLAHIEATETATTVIHLGKGDIDRFAALVPPDDVLAAFGAVADPLYARIVANKQACRSLAAIRDTLLPRLISGQLRLPDVVEAEAALA
ncbi:MAG: hypothetical protein WAQ05_21740 [Rubrivivax sp.]